MRINWLYFILLLYNTMAKQELAKVNMWMLERSQWGGTQSVLSNIHKLRVYNPNGFKSEVMDESKRGKFILTQAGTGEEVLLDAPFTFNILAHYKSTQGQVAMLTPDEDVVVKSNGEQDIRFFYTNNYDKFLGKDWIVWFKCNGMNPMWFHKNDFFTFLKSPKVNWLPNPFFEWYKDPKTNTKEKSTLLKNVDIIFWVFVDWPYKDEYFMMKMKSNLIWSNYNKDTGWFDWEAKEWTLQRILDDNLEWWNQILKDNGMKTTNRLNPEFVDLKFDITSVDVSGKEFNVGQLSFAGFTANRKDNLEDIHYIQNFNTELFTEWFNKPWMPLTVKQDGNNVLVDLDFSVEENLSQSDIWEVFDVELPTTNEAVKNWAAF